MTDHPQAQIEADADVPIIRIVRDFAASPAQLYRAHTDPDLYAPWVGPNDITTRIEVWDCHRGGSWAFSNVRGDESYSFHGCFPRDLPDPGRRHQRRLRQARHLAHRNLKETP